VFGDASRVIRGTFSLVHLRGGGSIQEDEREPSCEPRRRRDRQASCVRGLCGRDWSWDGGVWIERHGPQPERTDVGVVLRDDLNNINDDRPDDERARHHRRAHHRRACADGTTADERTANDHHAAADHGRDDDHGARDGRRRLLTQV
jgi:hypothetical protein